MVFLGRKNYEFILYIGVVAFFIVFISLLHLKYRFSNGVLIGMSLWGLMHMLGGGVIFNGSVLYAYQIFPFLRFDQFVHLFGFGFATLFAYHILKPNLGGKLSKWTISILLVFIGMGIGALNEIVEFAAVLIVPETGVGGYTNTMWDIVFNTIGAILAVLWINFKKEI